MVGGGGGGGGVGSSHCGFVAPFVQQYFPLPPLSQQSALLAPLAQQKGPERNQLIKNH